jgi:hypothetical protein
MTCRPLEVGLDERDRRTNLDAVMAAMPLVDTMPRRDHDHMAALLELNEGATAHPRTAGLVVDGMDTSKHVRNSTFE